jgi:hypothetical protein
MPLAANQQRRRAEIMPGGVIVELEIAMPQSRYVAHISKWFDAARSQRRDCQLRPLMGRNLMIFANYAANPGSRSNKKSPEHSSGLFTLWLLPAICHPADC